MIKCPRCGTDNLDSSQYCDECGMALNSYQTPNIPPPDYAPPSQPDFVSASITSVGIPPMVEEHREEFPLPEIPSQFVPSSELETTNSGIHSTLIIERGTAIGAEFDLSSDESYIGRWDADNGVFPDVDLDAHDPEAKVSRRHARIVRENGRYIIEDLGSTNGTFVNRGRRLIPGNRQPIEDGDEIIVGKTFLRFRINK